MENSEIPSREHIYLFPQTDNDRLNHFLLHSTDKSSDTFHLQETPYPLEELASNFLGYAQYMTQTLIPLFEGLDFGEYHMHIASVTYFLSQLEEGLQEQDQEKIQYNLGYAFKQFREMIYGKLPQAYGLQSKEGEMFRGKMMDMIKEAGLNPAHTINMWRENNKMLIDDIISGVYETDILDKFIGMLKLQRIDPTICKKLVQKYGIYNFNAFEPELLAAQCSDEYDETLKQGEYVVVTLARFATNNLLHSRHINALENRIEDGLGEHILQLYQQLQGTGCNVVFIEYGDSEELLARLLKLRRYIGSISGSVDLIHGAPDRVATTNQDGTFVFIHAKDLKHSQIARLARKIFSPDAFHLLLSCYTGCGDNSFGQQVSEICDALCISPGNSFDDMQGIAIRDGNNHVRIDQVVYTSKGRVVPSVLFHKGRRIE